MQVSQAMRPTCCCLLSLEGWFQILDLRNPNSGRGGEWGAGLRTPSVSAVVQPSSQNGVIDEWGVISVHPSLRGTQAPPTYSKSQADLLFLEHGKLSPNASPLLRLCLLRIAALRCLCQGLLIQASLSFSMKAILCLEFVFCFGMVLLSSPHLPWIFNPSASASGILRITGVCHHAPLTSASNSSSSYPFCSSTAFSSSFIKQDFLFYNNLVLCKIHAPLTIKSLRLKTMYRLHHQWPLYTVSAPSMAIVYSQCTISGRCIQPVHHQ